MKTFKFLTEGWNFLIQFILLYIYYGERAREESQQDT